MKHAYYRPSKPENIRENVRFFQIFCMKYIYLCQRWFSFCPYIVRLRKTFTDPAEVAIKSLRLSRHKDKATQERSPHSPAGSAVAYRKWTFSEARIITKTSLSPCVLLLTTPFQFAEWSLDVRSGFGDITFCMCTCMSLTRVTSYCV